MLIYRLEDSTGQGYTNVSGLDSIDSFTKDFMFYVSDKPYYNSYYDKRRPDPQADGLDWEGYTVSYRYHYGFTNLTDLKRYFNHNELVAALIYGAAIVCYVVEEQDTIILNHQVMFLKDKATRLTPAQLLEYLDNNQS